MPVPAEELDWPAQHQPGGVGVEHTPTADLKFSPPPPAGVLKNPLHLKDPLLHQGGTAAVYWTPPQRPPPSPGRHCSCVLDSTSKTPSFTREALRLCTGLHLKDPLLHQGGTAAVYWTPPQRPPPSPGRYCSCVLDSTSKTPSFTREALWLCTGLHLKDPLLHQGGTVAVYWTLIGRIA